ncbi:hypothetical protein OQA88_12526 [Cercophora sp. LCS_1]
METPSDPHQTARVRQVYFKAVADIAHHKSICLLHEEKKQRETKLFISKTLAARADQKLKLTGEIALADEALERLELELAAAREKKRKLTEDLDAFKTLEEHDAQEIKQKEEEREKFLAYLTEQHVDYVAYRYFKIGKPDQLVPPMISPPSPGAHTASEPEQANAPDNGDQEHGCLQMSQHPRAGEGPTTGTGLDRRQKRAARDSDGPGPGSARARKRARPPIEHDVHVTETISFDEVFQGGSPSNRFEIVKYPAPPRLGAWYILHCKEHNLCFGGNGKQAIPAAAKHLGSNDHGGTGGPAQHHLAIKKFGYRVHDCDGDRAEQNNSMVKRASRVTAILGGGDLILNPTAGEPYIATHSGSRWVVMVLPTDDFAQVGLKGTFDACRLSKKIPKCYKRRPDDGRLEWAEGYGDHGPRVQDRRFPVRYFSKHGEVEWISVEALKSIDLEDADNLVGICGVDVARDFYANIENYKRLAAEPDVGSDGSSGQGRLAYTCDDSDPDDDSNDPTFDTENSGIFGTRFSGDRASSYQPHGLPSEDSTPSSRPMVSLRRTPGESEQERRLYALFGGERPEVLTQQVTSQSPLKFALAPSQPSLDQSAASAKNNGSAPEAAMTPPFASNVAPGLGQRSGMSGAEQRHV